MSNIKVGDKVRLSITEIIKVLDAEILWCEQNPDKAFHAEYCKGFVNGLIQAKYLITSTNEMVAERGNQRRTITQQEPAQ